MLHKWIETVPPEKENKDCFREALPCGNGRVGTLLCGGTDWEKMLINHAALWHGGVQTPLPDCRDTLAKTRAFMAAGDYAAANDCLCDALHERGYQGDLSVPHPLALLVWQAEGLPAVTDYRRSLQLDSGEAAVSGRFGQVAVERRMFVSRTDEIIVWEMTATAPISGSFALQLASAECAEIEKAVAEMQAHLQLLVTDCTIRFYSENNNGLAFGCVLTAACDGRLVRDGTAIRFENARQLTLKLCPAVCKADDATGAAAWPQLSQGEAYATLLERHRTAHQALFGASTLSFDTKPVPVENLGQTDKLSAAQLEYLWHFGRYLLVSGTRTDGLPCPLFGLWHTGYMQYWSQNMANVNIQMIYWQAVRNGLGALYLPVIDYYFNQLEIFRENAQKLFGCNGIWIPAGTTPYEFYPNQIVPVIMNWTGAAAWLCADFYRYYIYTKDEKTFREKILPFMLETARFYEDFCQIDEQGKTVFVPSVSPENSPGNFFTATQREDMHHTMPTAANAAMDVALLRELYYNLILECIEYPEYEEKIGIWQRRLRSLPPYMFNQDGAVKEWQDSRFDDHYLHRHLSHLYAIFPGDGDSLSLPERQGFRRAMALRVADGQSGWSLAYSACIAARFGEGDCALKYLDDLGSACLLKNGMTTHNDWRPSGKTLYFDGFAPVQLDANMGLVQSLNEMLIRCTETDVLLLPACPERLGRGSLENFTVPGGRVSMQWDLTEEAVAVTFFADSRMNLKVSCNLRDYSSAPDARWSVRLQAGTQQTFTVRKQKEKVSVLAG